MHIVRCCLFSVVVDKWNAFCRKDVYIQVHGRHDDDNSKVFDGGVIVVAHCQSYVQLQFKALS